MVAPRVYAELAWHERRDLRNTYVAAQGGLCMYCASALSQEPPQRIRDLPIRWELFPPQFLRWPVHLQHDHRTGLTEGAVHAYCNAVLWDYEGR